jgi:hypothetical protein
VLHKTEMKKKKVAFPLVLKQTFYSQFFLLKKRKRKEKPKNEESEEWS